VAAIGHQLLGAIGFTVEHRLHLSTTRLWAWRQEFGNDRFWSDRLARMALASGTPIWHQLTEA
ncbi:MAG: acyl-CoA dehydrogenase family protein, partial [Actinomycetota bacterium]